MSFFLWIAAYNPCTVCEDKDSDLCKSCKNNPKNKKLTHYTPIEKDKYSIDIDFLNSEKFRSFSDKDKERIVNYWNNKVAPEFDELDKKLRSFAEE